MGGLGLSGASLGRFGALLGGHLALQNLAFVKHWPKMVSKKLFGSILEGFGEGSGRIWGGSWEDFGQFGDGFWKDLGQNLSESSRICTKLRQSL